MSKKKNSHEQIFTLCCLALLCAMQVVLARFLVIPISSTLRISFSFIPVVIAARRFGVLGAVTVYGLGDLIGAFAFPTTGGYLPGFTVTAAVSGLIFGLFLQKKGGLVRIVLSVVTSQIVCSLVMNSLWLNHYYGTELLPLIASRTVQCLVVGAVEILFMVLFLEKICSALKIRGR
ncbi:MAG: folate family ECF transporter S component [Clostridia bacterium]|nr:folate family ECF transporter S component [Clostridia bacterium]